MRRRIYSAYCLMLVMMIGVLSKIATVISSPTIHSVGAAQGSRTITVAAIRGTIYDRKLQPLVNRDKQYYAAFIPRPELLDAVRGALPAEEYQLLINRAQYRVPLSTRLERPVPIRSGLHLFHLPIRYGATCPAPHLLGYLDGSGQTGVSGIERAYNDVLSSHSGAVTVTYDVNGAGNSIENTEATVRNTVENAIGGVALTLDNEIQSVIDEIATEHLEKGAVIVLDARNGELLAMGSYPTFRPDEIAHAVSQSDGALLNRGLSLYDCGSIFKIVTSVAALESGIPVERCYHCPGEITVDDTTFHCHDRDGHGAVNMTMAFAKSCNVYYIQLAQEIGAAALLDMVERLGFRDEIRLADGITAPPAVLPHENDLTAAAALANLSFGQGKLLISPLHAARMTALMTANGTLLEIGAVLGLVKNNGDLEQFDERGGETVISSATVGHMRRMMEAVVTDGTGISAQPAYSTAAGKTGTAETGQVNESGIPVVQSWFTGYFPAEQPRYVVTVLAEDAQNTGNRATKVFCEISNKLM